jgi:hypothetical protein
MIEEHLIKTLLSSIKCSICGQSYEPEGIKIVAQKSDLWFIKVDCIACQSRALVAVKIDEERIKPKSDLSIYEQEHFADCSKLSTDDFLEMHQFLNTFNGDFKALFNTSENNQV